MAASSDAEELDRFVSAQDSGGVYARVVDELRNGRKQSHWIWFIFPQLVGLGSSLMTRSYSITSLAEARAYLEHPILGPRLLQCTRLVAESKAVNAESLLGAIDAVKLRSSMTLFARARPTEDVFDCVLTKYFQGEHDALTVRLLEQDHTHGSI
jgi:uncharacterized protein (DUF1810 family)